MTPHPPHPPRAAARWIAAIALLGLAAGVVVATRQWSGTRGPTPAGPEAGVDPVTLALEAAEDDDEKSRWVEAVPGLELSGLDRARTEIFLRHVNTRRCTCGCGYTLAACRVYDSSCEESLPQVEALRDSVAGGWIAHAEGLRQRPEAIRDAPGAR